MPSVRRVRRPLVALLVLVLALAVGYSVRAARSDDGGSARAPGSSEPVRLSSLPAQVAETVRLIRSDGPFPYPRDDGVTFHNYEHVLPREADGWYHEYTVPTPGSDDRGARRLITGRDGAYFYTDDHYETFRRVDLDE